MQVARIVIQVVQELGEGLTFLERVEFIQASLTELVLSLLPKE
jgi:hypothetical protein